VPRWWSWSWADCPPRSPVEVLADHVVALSTLTDVTGVQERIVAPAQQLAGMDRVLRPCAAITGPAGEITVRSGPLAAPLSTLAPDELEQVADWVAHGTSCYFAGGTASTTHGCFVRAGAGSVLVLPLTSRGFAERRADRRRRARRAARARAGQAARCARRGDAAVVRDGRAPAPARLHRCPDRSRQRDVVRHPASSPRSTACRRCRSSLGRGLAAVPARRPGRARPGRDPRRPRRVQRWSTTASVTTPVTTPSGVSPTVCPASCATATSSPASVATGSRSSARPGRSAGGGADRATRARGRPHPGGHPRRRAVRDRQHRRRDRRRTPQCGRAAARRGGGDAPRQDAGPRPRRDVPRGTAPQRRAAPGAGRRPASGHRPTTSAPASAR
jgi:hypothetical protein